MANQEEHCAGMESKAIEWQEDEIMKNGNNNLSYSNENRNDGDDDDENSDADDDWNEMEQDQEPTRCLFCTTINDSIELAIQHLDSEHGINLSNIKNKFNMDQYSYIRMINYIRTHNIKPMTILNAATQLWSDDIYLKPVEIDSWLMFDIDELKAIKLKNVVNGEKSDAHHIEDLQRQLKEKDELLEHLLFQIKQMTIGFQRLIERTDNKGSIATEANENSLSDNESVEPIQTYVGQVPINEDEGYFTTYAHFDIHHDMLSDVVRTSSYRDAIIKNKNLFENKLVIDVGCGTSILSMFASQAGAKEILAIDQSDIIYHAMDIARKNDIKNIKFLKGRLEDMKLPLEDGEKVDIIVSEWMGYFLLFEGMLDSVINARDKFLKPGGLLLPNRCNLSLVALGDEQRHAEYIAFWNDVYGFDMSPMQGEVLKEAIVEVCRNEFVLTEPVVLADFNVMTVNYTYPNFVYDFQLGVTKGGKITAFVGYFDTFFDLPNAVHFSTGPHTKTTHWKQVVFYIKTPVEVAKGDIVRGQFLCRRGLKDVRALCVQINVFNQTFFYSLN